MKVNPTSFQPPPPLSEPVEEVETAFPSPPLNYSPTKSYLDSIWGEINRYNIKTMADGRQYVVNALTGEAMERKDAKYFADRKKNILWIPKQYTLSPLDVPNLYPWKNPERAS